MKTENIVSILREDFITIGVIFSAGRRPMSQAMLTTNKVYTYKFKGTSEDITYGDYVVVEANGALSVARVAAVHANVEINPDAEFEYKWIVEKIDMAPYEQILQEDIDVSSAIQKMRIKSIREKAIQEIKEDLGIDDLKLITQGNTNV